MVPLQADIVPQLVVHDVVWLSALFIRGKHVARQLGTALFAHPTVVHEVEWDPATEHPVVRDFKIV